MPVATRAGTQLPRLVYGTAWKGADTADLVYEALRAGFRAVDTAAQPKHYREDLVAAGVRRALAEGVVAARADLYLQTKFTPVGGQDPDNMPYDASAPLAEQVRASVEQSLALFSFDGDDDTGTGTGTDSYLDCVVLHSPLARPDDTRAVWAALQRFVPARVRSLGISNATLADLQALPDVVATAAVVQNRFHARFPPAAYDVALRRFCGQQQPLPIVYQAFWTLTANAKLIRRSPEVQAVATGADVAPEVAFYGLLSLGLGGGGSDSNNNNASPLCPLVVLDGTSSPTHMTADLAGLAKIEAWARSHDGAAAWQAAVHAFQQTIGDEAEQE